MLNYFLIFGGKLLSRAFRLLNLGNGSTWPGHLVLKVNPHFIRDLLTQSHIKIILIAGTNGKTTTSGMIRTVLEKNGRSVIQNQSGANLLNGIASTLLLQTNESGRLTQDYAIFEVDENTLPLVLKEIVADYVVLNNLFRDQLDRYGEVDAIARKWKEALVQLTNTTLVLNADDPQIAFLGKDLKLKVIYYGLESKASPRELEHAADSIYCPNCGKKLQYKSIVFSHLGDWICPSCTLKRPSPQISDYPYFPLTGTYNEYNTLAAVAVLQDLGLSDKQILSGLQAFTPAFGRQERIEFEGKHIQIFLSKNPTGFNESLRTIHALQAKHVLFILNDGVADGRDISWVWDIDLEEFVSTFETIIVSGDRALDLGLRVKYAEGKFMLKEHIEDAIQEGLHFVQPGEVLYILPTYTAMLEVRKILTGKKIL